MSTSSILLPAGLSPAPATAAPDFTISLSESFRVREPVEVRVGLDKLLDFAACPAPRPQHRLRRRLHARLEAVERAAAAALDGVLLEGPFDMPSLTRALEAARTGPERLAAAQVWREREAERAHRLLKAELPVWSPIRWRGSSSAANAVEACAAVFDFDDGASIEDIVQRLDGRLLGALHTTLRHAPDHHRFRLVLPYAAPVPADRHADVLRSVGRLLPAGVDRACFDLAEWFIRPVRLTDDPTYRAVRLGGPDAGLLSVDLGRLPAPAGVATPSVTAGRRGDLDWDPVARRRHGLSLGGRLASAERAIRGLACPACRRRDAWFWLDPRGLRDARCNHRSTCGWQGPLADL